jgi:uncharacterized repeat protein (TIGR01451 family)
MFSRRRSLIRTACVLGPMLLAGCQALRGPEPAGPTFVAPPGPVVSGGTVRAVPPTYPQYQYGQTPLAPYSQSPAVTYGQPPAVPYGQPQAVPYGQSPYVPSPPPSGQSVQPQFAPRPELPNAPGAPGSAAAGPEQVTLRVTGPAQAAPGTTASYRFDIVNTSASVARNVVVICHLPDGWAYVSSDVAGAVSGRQVQWQLRDVPSQRTLAINASFRPETAGVANLCVDISTAGGQLTRSCATTNVAPATPGAGKTDSSASPTSGQLYVVISGPDKAAPGENVTFSVTVTNRGPGRATKLLVTDTFGAGFTHEVATSPIEKDLEDLDAGQSTSFKITFRVARPGRHCHEIEVAGAGGLRATAQACLLAAGSPKVSVRQVVTPTSAAAGGTVRFAIDVKNEGDVDLTGVVVSANFDAILKPTQATELRGRQALANLKDDRYELTPWRFERLEPGRSIQLDVECRAERAAASACGRITVTAQEGVREEALTCLKVEAGRP